MASSTSHPTTRPVRAVRVEVHGTVQGVGFRPHVYRLAGAHGLSGDVRNVDGHVVINASGSANQVTVFLAELVASAPPAARVRDVLVRETATAAPRLGPGFSVDVSTRGDPAPAGSGVPSVPADLSTCPACVRELFDPTDRRYRYPFLNCTDCGPRATIVDDLPYDRQRTAMAGWSAPKIPDRGSDMIFVWNGDEHGATEASLFAGVSR